MLTGMTKTGFLRIAVCLLIAGFLCVPVYASQGMSVVDGSRNYTGMFTFMDAGEIKASDGAVETPEIPIDDDVDEDTDEDAKAYRNGLVLDEDEKWRLYGNGVYRKDFTGIPLAYDQRRRIGHDGKRLVSL